MPCTSGLFIRITLTDRTLASSFPFYDVDPSITLNKQRCLTAWVSSLFRTHMNRSDHDQSHRSFSICIVRWSSSFSARRRIRRWWRVWWWRWVWRALWCSCRWAPCTQFLRVFVCVWQLLSTTIGLRRWRLCRTSPPWTSSWNWSSVRNFVPWSWHLSTVLIMMEDCGPGSNQLIQTGRALYLQLNCVCYGSSWNKWLWI